MNDDPPGHRIAWITGAGKGIGRAVALDLARRGWHVCVSARTTADLLSLANDVALLSGRVSIFPLDVVDRAKAETVFAEILAKVGRPDMVLLNAGTYVRFSAAEFSAEAFAHQMEVNVTGTVNCLDPVLKSMIAAKSGRIGVVSSLSAYRGLPLASAYGASKAALTNMCEALRPELERHGVLLSVIHPGFVRTPLTDRNDFPMPFLVDAETAARRIVDGLAGRRFEIAFPWAFATLLKAVRLLPDWLYFRLTRRLV